jgi:hypothetical protein
MKGCADIQNVGYIVPLPNHYMSDMPQGAWAGENRPFFLEIWLSQLQNSVIFATGSCSFSPNGCETCFF